LGQATEVGALGQVLADESVGGGFNVTISSDGSLSSSASGGISGSSALKTAFSA